MNHHHPLRGVDPVFFPPFFFLLLRRPSFNGWDGEFVFAVLGTVRGVRSRAGPNSGPNPLEGAARCRGQRERGQSRVREKYATRDTIRALKGQRKFLQSVRGVRNRVIAAFGSKRAVAVRRWIDEVLARPRTAPVPRSQGGAGADALAD